MRYTLRNLLCAVLAAGVWGVLFSAENRNIGMLGARSPQDTFPHAPWIGLAGQRAPWGYGGWARLAKAENPICASRSALGFPTQHGIQYQVPRTRFFDGDFLRPNMNTLMVPEPKLVRLL